MTSRVASVASSTFLDQEVNEEVFFHSASLGHGRMYASHRRAGREPGRCSPWQYAFDGAATLQVGEILRFITTEKLVSKIQLLVILKALTRMVSCDDTVWTLAVISAVPCFRLSSYPEGRQAS